MYFTVRDGFIEKQWIIQKSYCDDSVKLYSGRATGDAKTVNVTQRGKSTSRARSTNQ